ncbi:hypothetical protein ACM66B_000017 [Microbotryomycetes sp. NB124-2]
MGLGSCLTPLVPASWRHNRVHARDDRPRGSLNSIDDCHASTDSKDGVATLNCLDSYKDLGDGCSTLNEAEIEEKSERGLSADDKLFDLRREIKDARVDYYIVPTADAHGSEYVGACDKRRAYITGFTGSAGVAVVSQSEALLFTDSRYYTQAEKQLSSAWTLMKVGSEGVKNWNDWLADLPAGMSVGVDPTLLDYASYKSLLEKLKTNKVELTLLDDNLVDKIWQDRPSRSSQTVRLHGLEFTGKDARNKISDLRKALVKSDSAHEDESSAFLISSLTNIAWLLNLRGSDIKFSPFFYSYLMVPLDEYEPFSLWIQSDAVAGAVEQDVRRLGGQIRSYDSVFEDLRNYGAKVVCDSSISVALVNAVGESNVTLVKQSPVVAAQAIKNDVEIQGFKNAYRRDGAAWVRWAAWLEEEIEVKKRQLSEWEAAEKLTRYRERGEHFAGLAYENISATGPNAALPHYAPTRKSSRIIDTKTPYLNDSGAQYLDGTIDTTRTVHFGRPTSDQKRAFTRVLQGHIALDSCVFPKGTTGNLLDALARKPLWSEGMNYGHGTGHGVGQYLSVHEGPQGFTSSSTQSAFPLLPGHFLSNEPAYYELDSFGIRTESVMFVKPVQTRRNFGDQPWFGFERVTRVPIQTKMIEWESLSREEKKWIKEHNDECRRALMPLVKHDKRAVKYLNKQ